MINEDKLIEVHDVAERFDCDVKYVVELVDRGVLRPKMTDGYILFSEFAIDEFILHHSTINIKQHLL